MSFVNNTTPDQDDSDLGLTLNNKVGDIVNDPTFVPEQHQEEEHEARPTPARLRV